MGRVVTAEDDRPGGVDHRDGPAEATTSDRRLADRAAIVDKALARWEGASGFVGAYVIGSANRPYADDHSDVDLVVVLEDEAYRRLEVDDHYTMGLDHGPPPRKLYDLMVSSFGMLVELTKSDVDLHRFAFQFARAVRDPSGRIATVLRAGGELPAEICEQRLRVHYYEFLWHLKKVKRARQHGRDANARMATACALAAAVKCLFLSEGSWVSNSEWVPEELRLLGVPAPLLALVEACWLRLDDSERETALARAIAARLDEKGYRFHHNTVVLTNWAAVEADGAAAVRRWIRTF